MEPDAPLIPNPNSSTNDNHDGDGDGDGGGGNGWWWRLVITEPFLCAWNLSTLSSLNPKAFLRGRCYYRPQVSERKAGALRW